jgi:glycosyltransferase involved in cell wall biosynthesis
VKLSFVIPAHNEQALLPACLRSIHSAAAAAGLDYEIIVVDDASTDATAQAARDGGARVVTVNLRQIAAVRNAGAAAATGDALVFVDADTQVPPPTLAAALEALRDGAIGGGAVVRTDRRLNPMAWIAMTGWNLTSRLRRWAAGCFIFVQRDAFERIGGFDHRYYATEELDLSDRLKQQGRFVILRLPVVTSARKMAPMHMGTYLRLALRWLVRGRRAFEKRDGLDMWYDPKR